MHTPFGCAAILFMVMVVFDLFRVVDGLTRLSVRSRASLWGVRS